MAAIYCSFKLSLSKDFHFQNVVCLSLSVNRQTYISVSCLSVRRSCSIDKCPLMPGAMPLLSQRRDMVRSESLRVDTGDRSHRIFRSSDLIHGEVLGKGFFGQAVKVLLAQYLGRQ